METFEAIDADFEALNQQLAMQEEVPAESWLSLGGRMIEFAKSCHIIEYRQKIRAMMSIIRRRLRSRMNELHEATFPPDGLVTL